MTDDDEFGLDDPDLRVFFSIYGVIRFDAAAVAGALRDGRLTPMQAHGLANLLEGKHPQGLTLKMQGQGKGWKPAAEQAARYNRLMSVGAFVTRRLKVGQTLEEAVMDASEEFGVSDATVYRDLNMYRSQAPE